MRNFEYFEPSSVSEAVSLLAEYKDEAKVIAGGTDLPIVRVAAVLTLEPEDKVCQDIKIVLGNVFAEQAVRTAMAG